MTTAQNWVIIYPTSIHVNGRADDGAYRTARLIATNTSAPDPVSTEIDIYQRGLASLATNIGSLVFERNGALTQTFNVIWKRVIWNITHNGEGNDPFIQVLTPTTGGGINEQGTTTITVTVPSNTGRDNLFEVINVIPQNNSDIDTVTMDVMSESQYITYSYVGVVSCTWLSSTQIYYQIFIQNNNSNDAVFQGGTLYIRTTERENQNPATADLEKSVNLSNFATATANTTTLVKEGTITLDRARIQDLFYWVTVGITNVHADYSQIEESPGEGI